MEIANRIGEMLRARRLTLGTAESCTGGYIAHLITRVPGSSDYFLGSVVSYSNEVKARVLGVSDESLERQGAVSRQVVEQMVQGAVRVLGCDCAVATSGIAGPGGGTEEKPVGLVYIGCYVNGETTVKECRFEGSRMENRLHTVETALQLLLRQLSEE